MSPLVHYRGSSTPSISYLIHDMYLTTKYGEKGISFFILITHTATILFRHLPCDIAPSFCPVLYVKYFSLFSLCTQKMVQHVCIRPYYPLQISALLHYRSGGRTYTRRILGITTSELQISLPNHIRGVLGCEHLGTEDFFPEHGGNIAYRNSI